MFGEKLSYLV